MGKPKSYQREKLAEKEYFVKDKKGIREPLS